MATIPLNFLDSIKSRDSTAAKDAKLVNCFVGKVTEHKQYAVKRSGYEAVSNISVGVAQMMAPYSGVLCTISNGELNYGSATQALGDTTTLYDFITPAITTSILSGTIVGSRSGSIAKWTGMLGMHSIGFAGYAYAISADGTTIVGAAYPAGFWWTAASGLNIIADAFDALAVSSDGSVIVGTMLVDSRYTAYRWTAATGAVDLGTLGGTESYATGVSADGTIVVGYSSTAGDIYDRAFRWTAETGMVSLGVLSGSHSRANAISADGLVIVGGSTSLAALAQRAFRWTAGAGMEAIVAINGYTQSYATAVSSDGSTIVGVQNGTEGGGDGFVWTVGTGAVSLGVTTNAIVEGVSPDGSIVVGSTASGAFRWTAGTGFTYIAPAGSYAYAIAV